MGKALYRTYRSKKLSEIVGQEHITTALDHALKKGTISHAYLFTGPRGVGKTSIARILAHEINNLPYEEDRSHLDIIEIDAASNRRIDEIRDLRDKVHIAPSSAKYKIYIIDEVHMLTKEAFNALLKTLEEPPAHVIFILATTEVHKLPETIVSRTQRFAFKPVDLPKVIAHLRHISDQEKIEISDEALALIAAHGEGSFRDSISLLDQIRNTGHKIELADVQAVLGIAPTKLIVALLESLTTRDGLTLVKVLTQIYDQGYEPTRVAKQLGSALRQELLSGNRPLPHETVMKLLGQLVQIPASPDPRIALEIALLDVALARSSNPSSPAIVTSHNIQAIAPAAQTAPANNDLDIDSSLILDDKAWDLILNALKKKHSTIYSLVHMANVHFDPGVVTLEFNYAFHQKRLNESRNKDILSGVVTGVTGSKIQIICISGEGKVAPRPAPPATEGEIIHTVSQETPDTPPKTQTASIETISNIFGGAEVLES
ncbi:MAG TPA: DNA polymerase III subunit gamma/tau [Candidatus Saccharimonadales bacterium]|nr:DNA polymerase III subunit gamma/tau [Candidatus Saccharimonadales bacterium]